MKRAPFFLFRGILVVWASIAAAQVPAGRGAGRGFGGPIGLSPDDKARFRSRP